jgi:hypothetical protein
MPSPVNVSGISHCLNRVHNGSKLLVCRSFMKAGTWIVQQLYCHETSVDIEKNKYSCGNRCEFVWFNVRQHNNLRLGKKNSNGAENSQRNKNAFTLVASLPRKCYIITTQHNAATQKISIRVSRLTFLTNDSVFTPRIKYISIPEAMSQLPLPMATRNQRLTKLTVC